MASCFAGEYGYFLSFAGLCWAAVNGCVVPALSRCRSSRGKVVWEQRLLVGALGVCALARWCYLVCDALGLPGLMLTELLVALGGATFFATFATLISR